MATSRVLALLAALFFCSAVLSPLDTILIPNGFGTGLDFVERRSEMYMGPRERMVYARGLINGLSASGLLGASNSRIEALQTCMTGMTDVQVAAILEKYITDNPKEWHRSLSSIGFSAIGKACDLFPVTKP